MDTTRTLRGRWVRITFFLSPLLAAATTACGAAGPRGFAAAPHTPAVVELVANEPTVPMRLRGERRRGGVPVCRSGCATAGIIVPDAPATCLGRCVLAVTPGDYRVQVDETEATVAGESGRLAVRGDVRVAVAPRRKPWPGVGLALIIVGAVATGVGMALVVGQAARPAESDHGPEYWSAATVLGGGAILTTGLFLEPRSPELRVEGLAHQGAPRRSGSGVPGPAITSAP